MRPLTAVFRYVGHNAAGPIGRSPSRARFFPACPTLLRAGALATALLAVPFTAKSQNYTASSNNSTSAITISSGNYTISVGSSGSLTRSNAITLSGGTLQGGIMRRYPRAISSLKTNRQTIQHF